MRLCRTRVPLSILRSSPLPSLTQCFLRMFRVPGSTLTCQMISVAQAYEKFAAFQGDSSSSPRWSGPACALRTAGSPAALCRDCEGGLPGPALPLTASLLRPHPCPRRPALRAPKRRCGFSPHRPRLLLRSRGDRSRRRLRGRPPCLREGMGLWKS